MLIALLAKMHVFMGIFSPNITLVYFHAQTVFDGLMRRVMMSLKDTLDFEVF